MTPDQILLGLGLTAVLAVGSQIARDPAAGAGADRAAAGRIRGGRADPDVINPNQLLGPAFQPLVALAVALILYDAGLGLDLRKLIGHNRDGAWSG